MRAIAAVDSNWAIGNKGRLLVSIPADHKMFRKTTMDKVIVYGRKTLETFPMQHILDGRTNIILSRNQDLKVNGAIICHSIEELLETLKDYDQDDIYVIGGASVYKELLPYIDLVEITAIDYEYEADAYFPNLDADPEWEVTQESDEQTFFDVAYTFKRYERKNKG